MRRGRVYSFLEFRSHFDLCRARNAWRVSIGSIRECEVGRPAELARGPNSYLTSRSLYQSTRPSSAVKREVLVLVGRSVDICGSHAAT